MRGHRGSDWSEQHALPVEPAIEKRDQPRIVTRVGVDNEAFERGLAVWPRSWTRAQQRGEIVEVAFDDNRADLVEPVEVASKTKRNALLV